MAEPKNLQSKISHVRLTSVLEYDPATGTFRWKITKNSRRANKGDVAGYVESRGYRTIAIDRRKYRAHALAWFYVHRCWKQIDHKNAERDDNRLENLRACTTSQNAHNSHKHLRNTSGFKGVSFVKARNKWQAQIRLNGLTRGLGHFCTPEEAYAAYCQAAHELHGEFARVS